MPHTTPPIFSHITIGTDDLARARAFYDPLMATLDIGRHSAGETYLGYGHPGDAQLGTNSLWVLRPRDGQRATGGNGTNVAFLARSREAVRQFHAVGLAQGGSDEGPPGLRTEVHASFYAAYLRDPDGNKLVAVCHDPVGTGGGP